MRIINKPAKPDVATKVDFDSTTPVVEVTQTPVVKKTTKTKPKSAFEEQTGIPLEGKQDAARC